MHLQWPRTIPSSNEVVSGDFIAKLRSGNVGAHLGLFANRGYRNTINKILIVGINHTYCVFPTVSFDKLKTITIVILFTKNKYIILTNLVIQAHGNLFLNTKKKKNEV